MAILLGMSFPNFYLHSIHRFSGFVTWGQTLLFVTQMA